MKTTLTVKQQMVISKNNITVEHTNNLVDNYIFLISGVYYQQKGFKNEYDAYIAAIKKTKVN